MTLEDLITRREALLVARFRGVRAVEIEGRRHGPGSFFGEMALLTGEPRSADVTALDFSKFLTLSRRDFQRFLKKHPSMREHIVTQATERGAMNRKLLEATLAESDPPVNAT